mgnify:CR=1 FL=1
MQADATRIRMLATQYRTNPRDFGTSLVSLPGIDALLEDARALLVRNSMAAAAGIVLPPQEPLAHYARELQVLVWPPERVGSSG